MTWVIAIIGLIAGGFIVAVLWIIFAAIRLLVANVTNPDDYAPEPQPRVRTRIQHSPIETEVADALAREYPNRKPATFL